MTVTVFVTSRIGVNVMTASAACGVCVGVKSRSVFPDLLPFETKVDLASQRRVSLALAKFGASCREVLASLPLFALGVFVAMLIFATD